MWFGYWDDMCVFGLNSMVWLCECVCGGLCVMDVLGVIALFCFILLCCIDELNLGIGMVVRSDSERCWMVVTENNCEVIFDDF